MFERFTAEARRVVVLAQEEARALRADRIDPVHLLLAGSRDDGSVGQALRSAGVDHPALRDALARSGSDLDADALAAVGIDLATVRAATEATFGPGALERGAGRSSVGHLPFAAGSKRALQEALRFALAREDRRIESRHVLFGVLAVDDPAVGRVLRQLGSDLDALRARMAGSDAA